MYKIYNNDCLNQLDKIEENSIDSIVTDPPYGLTSIIKRFGKENSAPAQYGKDGSFARLSKGFMGKEWDGSGIEYNVELWKKCIKVLKPGGHLLAFGGSRTFHRIACAIEDAGFEIRDTIMWLYGSGFPKSMNIGLAIDKKNGVDNRTGNIKTDGKATDSNSGCYNMNNGKDTMKKEYEERKAINEWSGWGTALKPSFEPIIVARKPFKGSLVDNVIEYGVGGINIDECRVETNGELVDNHNTKGIPFMRNKEDYKENSRTKLNIGRFPANTILTYDETDFDEVCGGFPNTKSGIAVRHNSGGNTFGGNNKKPPMEDLGYNDSGSASRYFYCAKASKKDRDEGLNEFETAKVNDGRQTPIDNAFQRGETLRKNTHPTVKPTKLMQYLVRLVTPKGGTILDPFMGSGSTGKAVMFENKERNSNYSFIGIEKEKEYCDIAKARIEWAKNYKVKKENENQISFEELLEEE